MPMAGDEGLEARFVNLDTESRGVGQHQPRPVQVTWTGNKSLS